MRAIVAVLVVLSATPAAAADNQIRAFLGGTFGGSTTLVDLEHASGRWNPVIGGSLVVLNNVFGVDVDVADAPGFFQSDESGLVLSSRVTTFTSNIVIAAPRSKTEYGIRPYIVAGAGVMRSRKRDFFATIPSSKWLGTLDVGAGAIGFFTNRSGVSWEIRRFEGLPTGDDAPGTTVGERGRLSFWRASMAFVYRY